MLKACHYSLYVAVGYHICENTHIFITFIKLHNKTVKRPSVKSVFTFYTTDQLFILAAGPLYGFSKHKTDNQPISPPSDYNTATITE